MLAEPQLQAPIGGAVIKVAMGAVIAGDGLEKIIRTTRIVPSIVLLGVVALPTQVTIESCRGNFVGRDGNCRGGANVPLSPVVVRRPDDGGGGDLGLKNGRHGLRLARQATLHP